MNTYNAAAVVLHIDEILSSSEMRALERKLIQARGVQSAQVSERTQHLLVVKYDPQHASSFNLLNNISVHDKISNPLI
jgi:primosomal protein N'